MDTEGQPQTPEGNQVQGVTEDPPDTCVNLPLKCLGNKRAKPEKWFRENIKKKECAHFVKSDASSDGREKVCYCGNAKSQHKYKDRNPTESQWDQETHIKEVATDAYGDLIFKDRGKKKAKYVRASDSTPPEVLYEMMIDQWQLKVPKLVISVNEGPSNVNDSLKKVFCQGLIKAAQSTGAWIITGGCHPGVAKLVGEAVQGFSRSGRGYHDIVTIGIAQWGTICNRHMLIRKKCCQPVKYSPVVHSSPDVPNQSCLLPLDNNHSHFILVDDGKRRDYSAKIPLWTKLESLISEQSMKEGADMKIPIVSVVLAGSRNSLDIQYSVLKSSELTVVREDKDVAEDMDVTDFLLKASQSVDPENRVYQLYLAVLWNRLDIAKNDIFNIEWSWESKDLYPALTVALIENKMGFVQLFLEKGVRLRDYVTEKTLINLYNYMKPNTHFGWKLNKIKRDQQKNKDGVTRQHIDEALKRLYTFRKELQTAVNNTGQSPSDTYSPPPSEIAYPIRDLLIWAVVQNCGELAEIIWTQCQDCIVGALACSMILRALYKKEQDINTVEEMKVLANLFEERASGVFSECCREDEGRAEQLLTRRSSGWGEATCLQLAGNTKAMSFMSNGGVQNYLTKMWYGKLSKNNSFIRLLICMIVFPLACTDFITLRQKKSGTLNCCERLCAFFNAPVVIFYYNVVSYIGFLWLFAYVLMMDFQTTPSCIEYLLYVWVFSLLCEEGRQLFNEHEDVKLLTKFCMYINDFWNQMDVLAIVLFIIGLVFRWFTASFYAARVIFAVDYIVFCLRLMDDFTVNRILGPKIIMVQKMIKDLYFFLFLLAVWVVSFGVSKQAILVHNEQRFYWIFRNVLYEPYLILFGQIPADVDTLNFNNNICTADGSDASLPKCVETLDGVPIFPEWLTIILLCLYLLFAIILLLNLLIAMFNHTFSEVQGNTDQFWKFQRQKLIVEYSKRPIMPPPPILFNYLISFLYNLFKKCKLKKENGDLGLLSWEEKMKIDYLKKKKEEQSQSTDMKIRDIYDKIDAVVKLQNNVTAIQKRQEEQVSKGLKDIMKLLKENRSEEKAPVVEDPPSS